MSDGKEQAEQYAELAKPWQPDELAGYRIGDAVRLPGIDAVFEITGFADPLVIIRAPSGRELKAGWQSLTKIRKGGQRHE